jgi:hypothetical protein
MTLKLFEQVALRRDIPDQKLRAGDVARLIDIVPGLRDGPSGAILEVFNALGQTMFVASVSVEDVEPLSADEVFSVRPMAEAV